MAGPADTMRNSKYPANWLLMWENIFKTSRRLKPGTYPTPVSTAFPKIHTLRLLT